MKSKLKIEGISVYHPEKVITNDYYIEHFLKQGKDVRHLLEDVYGRKERFVIDNENISEPENSLTMQIIAAKQVLEQCNIAGQDIDGIISVCQFAEYTTPPHSAFIHKAIDGHNSCLCYDLNANCVGMLMAMEHAAQYMACNASMEQILIVAGDYMNFGVSEQEEQMYGVFGDSACAMIVSKSSEASVIIDTDRFYHNTADSLFLFPACGFTNIFSCTKSEILATQIENTVCNIETVAIKIRDLLIRNNLDISDINLFCFSQYARFNIDKLCKLLEISFDKCPYIGDIYGYTGANSPILALNSAIASGKVKRGDYILFWTLGSGMQHIFMLLKY